MVADETRNEFATFVGVFIRGLEEECDRFLGIECGGAISPHAAHIDFPSTRHCTEDGTKLVRAI